MAIIKHMQRPGLRRHALSAAALAFFAGACTSAAAFEFETGNEDVQLRLDNTVRYNLGYRTEKQDASILGAVNSDDGDRNFNKNSIVTNRVDLLSELDLVYKKRFGARV